MWNLKRPFLKASARRMTAVMICLGGSNSWSETDVLKLLNVLFSSETGADEKRRILQQDFDIPMTQSFERTVDVMCNFSKGVWEKGMEAGVEKAMLNSIKTLMETLGLTIEQAMSALRVSDADQPKYLEALEGHAQSNG